MSISKKMIRHSPSLINLYTSDSESEIANLKILEQVEKNLFQLKFMNFIWLHRLISIDNQYHEVEIVLNIIWEYLWERGIGKFDERQGENMEK